MLLHLILVLFPFAAPAAARFQVEALDESGGRAYVLRDSATGASARVCPQAGNQCVALQLPGPDGRLRDVLTPPKEGTAPSGGTQQGIPILFPWPGRIPDGEYLFRGKRYQLATVGQRSRAAMHGFVEKRPWKVEKVEADGQSARITCRITAADCPDTAAGYPFGWSLRVTHTLSSAGLSVGAEVRNTGSASMPFGFGLHPWLSMPLAEGAQQEECLLQVPAAKIWNMELLDRLTADQAAQPGPEVSGAWRSDCPPGLNLSVPAPLTPGPTVLYTGLRPEGSWVESRLSDPAAGLETLLRFTSNLGTVVVFKPRGGRSVCIEPWSCPPNAFNLAAAGEPDSGLTVLPPGGVWQAACGITLRPIPR